MWCPHFRFLYESLIFMPNIGHYMPKSPCSSPNGLLFTPNSLSGLIRVSTVPSGRHGGGGLCCMHEARCVNIVVVVDSNGWVCAGVSEMILARDIYCEKTNPKPDPQYSYRVRKGLGTRAPQSTWDCDLATVISIRPLNQPSIFSAMSWIKVASRIWAALCIIPST